MITIDSQYLRVFSSLARHLNMGQVAQELKLTPSGISHCLKALEADLGCKLFDRTSRKISLTTPGTEFLADADSILQRMTAARTRLRSWGDWRRGELRIAASATACQYLLPRVLREFRESFREFTLQIVPGTSPQTLAALEDGRVDLAVVVQPRRAPRMKFIPIAVDELQYLVNPLHPWVAKRKAIPGEIARQQFILPERASETRGLIDAYFRPMRIRLHPGIEIGSEEATKELVRLDLGVGLLPKWIAAEEIRQGSLATLPIGRRRLRRTWGVLHARSRKLTFPENVLLDLCRNVATELMADRRESASTLSLDDRKPLQKKRAKT